MVVMTELLANVNDLIRVPLNAFSPRDVRLAGRVMLEFKDVQL